MEKYECPDCKGTGCIKCNKTGYIDWVENVVGVSTEKILSRINEYTKQILEKNLFEPNDENTKERIRKSIDESLDSLNVKDYKVEISADGMKMDVDITFPEAPPVIEFEFLIK